MSGTVEKAEKKGYVFCGGSISWDFLSGLMRSLSRTRTACTGNDTQNQKQYIVAADKGLVFLDEHGVIPDLVVGDFDSSPSGFIGQYRKEHPEVKIRRYNPEKDYTDSEIGARAAAQAGCGRVVLIGATGTRLDHVLGNLQVLAWLLDHGVKGVMIDPYNRVTLHDRPFSIQKSGQWGKYVSLFSFGGDVTGLTLTGFHYDVKDFLLTSLGSRAVSNEIDEEEGVVRFSSGKLLVIESRDTPRRPG